MGPLRNLGGLDVWFIPMSTETMALTLENVEKVLDELRPFLMADGGNVEVVELCLLYTSPSPRDLSTSRMPSSA